MKLLLFFFILVTLINGFIFYFREKFEFVKYSTYDQLYGNCNEDCMNKWKTFTSPYPEDDLQEAQQILQPLRLDTASTLSKVRLIGNKIYTQFQFQGGVPENKVSRANPVDQYKALQADTSQKLWCGTYAQMFGYFCWSQNIVCRNIEIFKPGDHHVFNECYIPELKQWVLVDITNRIIWLQSNNRLLNMQDFLNEFEKKQRIFALNASTLRTELLDEAASKNSIASYYKKEYSYYYYQLTNTATVYKTPSKIKRYILPDYWYEIFSPVKKTNILFYIKESFLALWLILLGGIFIKRIIK